MAIIDIIINIVLAVFSIVFALWYENRGTPRLIISPDPTSDDKKQDGRRARFLHLRVNNNPRKWRFVTRQSAYACHGNVTFYTSDFKPLGMTIPIKWDGTPEPVKYEVSNGKVISLLDPNLLRLTRYIDIPPDESESLAIAVRILGDDCAYGWTGDSYIYNWRHPKSQLLPGKYIARVYLTTGDSTIHKDFSFENSEEYEKFDLLPEPNQLLKGHKRPAWIRINLNQVPAIISMLSI